MAASFGLTPLILLFLDGLVYAILMLGIVVSRRMLLPRVDDPDVAFGLLEKSVIRAYPDLKDGFTWREALARIRGADARIDWPNVMATLADYEAYKYGNGNKPAGSFSEIVRLASKIRMKSGIGRRT